MTLSLDTAASRPSPGAVSPSPRMPSRSRTQSISSDRPSTVAHSLMSPPLSVSPEPAFIAASAASQIVTNDHDSHAETWYDQHGIEPSGETAAVSPGALQLVNNFLDQLLFNFLCTSRSTALSTLRPAVTEVLKPKLAKDAINQADEELREYLGGDDEEGPQTGNSGAPTDWDLELAWKRTRLRCMVYSSLGDMEEEDEDYYMEQGHLDAGPDGRFSETVSPAVAIFLTSILEFMGEQALIVAGQAAYHRMRLKYEKDLKDGARSPTGVADRIVVEELDMERVALDRTFGRLWRSWKKKIRSPGVGAMDRLARSFSRDSLHSAGSHLRSTSSAAELAVPATVPEPDAETEQGKSEAHNQGKAPDHDAVEEYLIAAGIPLPLGPNDIAEIEVPGLAHYADEEKEKERNRAEEESRRSRPKSLIFPPFSTTPGQLTTSTTSPPQAPRKRSSSLPASTLARYAVAEVAQPDEAGTEASTIVSPAESQAAAGALSTAQADAADPNEADVTEEDDLKEDEDDEISIEEPRIVTSARVSIVGRTPSNSSVEQGKPPSIITNLPVRTPSIHSARLIEVTSPRSPALGSRRNSVAVTESTRHSSSARTSRTVTPPVPEDRPGQALESVSGDRLTVVGHANKSGLAASMSISESEESADKEYSVSPITPITPPAQPEEASQPAASAPAAPEPVAKRQYDSAETTFQSRPSTPGRAITTKVTVLPGTSSPMSTASSTSGTFFIESMPVLREERHGQETPRGDSQRSRASPAAHPPAVPERSSGRQTPANTSALRQPAPIGQVSVERSRARSPSQGSLSRPGEASVGHSRQQQSSGSPSSAKLKAVRTSEETMQSRIDVVRDFEELIQSDQTIQYTLTPESMRDMDGRSITAGSPVVSVKTRKSEEARRNRSRSRSSSVPRNDARAPAPGPVPRSSGSGSHSVTDGHYTNKNFPTATGKHGGVVPRSIPPMPSKPRSSSGPQARDARLPRESLAEFAEFIRSTGPAGAGASAASISSSSRPARARNPGSVSNISIETGRVSTTSNPNRLKLQARGATVDHKDDNSDLIDFIRRGPPAPAGNHRIPRTVAPFRSTMDSDQMAAAVGGKAVDAQLRDVDMRSSQTSNSATESSVPPSIQSSINSRRPLLAQNQPMSYSTTDTSDDMPIPKRKTRRVRDPYAIDLSDEEEMENELMEEDLAPPPGRKMQTQDESLIDFLNNYAPPPEPTVQPFNIPQTRNTLKPKKKASAPSLMARFTRRDSGQSGNAAASNPAARPVTSQMPAQAPRSVSSRAGGAGKGGHVPIQVNIPGGVNGYVPPVRTSSRPAADGLGPPLGMGGGGHPRGPMKKFEPREAVSGANRATSDLADFFKHSGPPPGMSPPVANQFSRPAERAEPTNGFSRVFPRRKKPSIS
ncbi:uncharacterized protein B0T15DRAFT_133239 [Chaetomium strumarium]|uniref:Uncharacterized protein n=1 Tax=Chaetomium strumarium TaxID=1170767 RepID=A0AAJ0M538_9PEZI|nr:hypothetical protein B0T15DRAFT_133239 [Chaetomium strumarium]